MLLTKQLTSNYFRGRSGQIHMTLTDRKDLLGRPRGLRESTPELALIHWSVGRHLYKLY